MEKKSPVKVTRYAFTSRNLQRYFGLPPFNELSSGGWLDHYYIQRVERGGETYEAFNRVELVSEPYQLGSREALKLINLCTELHLNLLFSGGAEHNAGCMQITIWRGEL
jgi:hypothetical protein